MEVSPEQRNFCQIAVLGCEQKPHLAYVIGRVDAVADHKPQEAGKKDH